MRRFSLLLPIALLACSDDSTTTSSGSTTGSGMGGSGVTASSSSTGLSVSSSSSSGSGTGGAAPVAGAPGSDIVSAGEVCTSPNFKMIMTFGQPTQNQAPMSSPNFKAHGGLIGATN